jgi:hypothetical protein
MSPKGRLGDRHAHSRWDMSDVLRESILDVARALDFSDHGILPREVVGRRARPAWRRSVNLLRVDRSAPKGPYFCHALFFSQCPK